MVIRQTGFIGSWFSGQYLRFRSATGRARHPVFFFEQRRHGLHGLRKDLAQVDLVDIITFGSPCQGLSISGRRLGLADERSGLFSEAIRIIREMQEVTHGQYPQIAIWENVPYALQHINDVMNRNQLCIAPP